MSQQTKTPIYHKILRVILPFCLIAAGVMGFRYFKSLEMTVTRRPPVKAVMKVETISVAPGDYHGSIQAMGTVVPDREVSLRAQVTGEVVFLAPSFVRGGVMKKGQVLLKLDDADYQIEVQKAQSALDRAQSDLAIELGNQQIAREEYELIKELSSGEIRATDLALRKPQLDQANAVVKNARADLEKAELDLSRTVIKVPFNSLVLEKNVDMGSFVTVQEAVAGLVNVDIYHVEVLVPPDQLEAITTELSVGSKALIRSTYTDHTWQGRVVRRTGRISTDSRMAGVLVAVDDPLGINGRESGPVLMLNDYVRVDIRGKLFQQVYQLPRNLLRDGDTVWINNTGKLDIRKVDVAWKQDRTVYIDSGLSPDDAVIVTDLPAPVSGMAVENGNGVP